MPVTTFASPLPPVAGLFAGFLQDKIDKPATIATVEMKKRMEEKFFILLVHFFLSKKLSFIKNLDSSWLGNRKSSDREISFTLLDLIKFGHSKIPFPAFFEIVVYGFFCYY
jgi:hypothetical protein